MKHTSIIIVVIGLALSATRPASATQPGNARSFVSPTGSDANSCTLAAPCRTFAQAMLATNAGGEIAVLGTAGYGTLTIDKAISIVNPGGFEAGIAVPSGGTGIAISAGTNDAVSLRGLTIEGGGVGAVGIQFTSGQSLTIENCVIRHMVGFPHGNGIEFEPAEFVPNPTSTLSVSSSVLSENEGYGILFLPGTGGTFSAVVDHVKLNHNAFGLLAGANFVSTGSVNVTLSDSVVANNVNVGVYAQSQPGMVLSILNILRSVVADNAFGVQSLSGTVVGLSQSMLTGNGTGYDARSGELDSYGDNYIRANGANLGSLTTATKQ